jgi:gamma-glutamyltranspeptidase/glutathione hydrolase
MGASEASQLRNFEAAGRSPVLATEGMAATSHPLSTLTAITVLQQGGNALDAAVAACAVQCVVEPGSTGLGGDCFAFYAPAGGGTPIAFNGSGRAPAAATEAFYAATGLTEIPRQSPHAVTVPGAVDAWSQLLDAHGSRDLGELLQPAIRLADQGYAISPRVHFDWREQVGLLAADPAAHRIFLVDGKAPAIGSRHRQPELAATLREIAKHGRDAFYSGWIAADMVETLSALGGLHTLDDFRQARGEFVTPISTRFRGYDVVECPPNGQGVIALILLNILAAYRGDGDPIGYERLQLEIEAARLAYAVRDAYLADPAAARVSTDWLLSEPFAAALRARLVAGRLCDVTEPLPGPAHSDTVYISVVDKDRNSASFINSTFMTFGSGLVAPRSGIVLHNRGMSFSLNRDHPNVIAPGKRPMHTIIPGLLLKEGRVQMSFGVMGGHYQAMGHAYLLTRILDYGLDLQAAMDLPRLFPLPGTRQVEIEDRFAPEVAAGLQRAGYEVVRAPRPIGGAQAIWIDWDKDVLIAGSDPRKDGCALGY